MRVLVTVDIITIFILSTFGIFRFIKSSCGEIKIMPVFGSTRIARDLLGNFGIVTVFENFPLEVYLKSFAKDAGIRVKIQPLAYCFTDIYSFKESNVFSYIQACLENPSSKEEFQTILKSLELREKIYLEN